MKEQQISIIIPALTREERIASLIEHLGRMRNRVDIIVMDGGSTGNTLAAARQHQKAQALRAKKNAGPADRLRVTAAQAGGFTLHPRGFFSAERHVDLQALAAVSAGTPPVLDSSISFRIKPVLISGTDRIMWRPDFL